MVKFSPDGRMLVSKDGGNVRLWEVATGKEIRRLLEAGGEPARWSAGQVPAQANGSARVAASCRVFAGRQGRGRGACRLGWTKVAIPHLSVGNAHGQEDPRDRFSSEKLTLGKFEQVVAPTVRAVTFSPDGKTLAAAGGYWHRGSA